MAAEAKTILPHRARSRYIKMIHVLPLLFLCYVEHVNFVCALISRPDLMDNYLALILSAFIRNGLLEVMFRNLYSVH